MCTPRTGESQSKRSILGGGIVSGEISDLESDVFDPNSTQSQSGGKLLPIILIDSVSVSELCWAFIGSHKKSFCLKHKGSCSILLNGGVHATSKFLPLPGNYYVCKSLDWNAAWCDISFSEESAMGVCGNQIEWAPLS